MIKFQITRYDKRIKKPPFRAVKPFVYFELSEFFEDEFDYLGERRYSILVDECIKRGLHFKFYTQLEKGSYQIFVY